MVHRQDAWDLPRTSCSASPLAESSPACNWEEPFRCKQGVHTNYKDSGGTYTHGFYPFLWVVVEGEFAHKVCGLTVRSVAWDLS